MRKIKIAQIGVNKYSHGHEIFKCMTERSDIFEIVGYAMPEDEKERLPEKLKTFLPYKEMTVQEIMANPEIDAVTVETEEIYLSKYALMAAEHGKHIHMEKPGGASLAEFEQLINAVKKSGKVFHIGYMYRYNPYVQKLMQKIKDGELGDIISVEAQMNSCHPDVDRQWLGTFKGGNMFFLGCHLIDLILQIQGIPKEVIPLNCCTGINGITSEDFGMAVLGYERGYSFAKTAANEVGGGERRQLVVSGTKSTVEIKPLEIFSPDGLQSRMTEYGSASKTITSPVYDRYEKMLVSFAAMVRGEEINPWDYDYELNLYKTILKCCGELSW